jgi:MFS family permease
MTADATPKIPIRAQVAIYGTGIFSNSANAMVNVIIPLWLIKLEASPFMVGLALGARFILPSLLSIHGGVLMDRIGTRRVLLFFSIFGMILPPLHPLMPWPEAVVVFQMIGGLVSTMGWVACQTIIGQIIPGAHGEAGMVGFSHRVGSLVAAPLAGFVWDLLGPYGGFSLMGIWGVGLTVSALLMPDIRPSEVGPQRAVTLREVMPRWADYRGAFALMGRPAIAVVVALSMFNLAGGGIQGSFFVVYMENIGLTGTLIGTLMSTYSVVAAAGNLLAAPLARFASGTWILLGTIALNLACLVVTPLLTTFAMLMGMAVLRGASQGAGQPLMITAASRSVDAKSQGKAVGLRVTANRIALMVVPIVMGAVVEAVGLHNSFYVVAGGLLAMTLGVGVIMLRSPQHYRD